MAQVNDLSRSLTAFDPISTLVVVVEMSKASWLVSGAVPGVERQPLKKLAPDAPALCDRSSVAERAVRAGRPISRSRWPMRLAARFWLARWLMLADRAHVIHSASVRITQRKREDGSSGCGDADARIPGWLRVSVHCGCGDPTMEEEDASAQPQRKPVNNAHASPTHERRSPSRSGIQATSAQAPSACNLRARARLPATSSRVRAHAHCTVRSNSSSETRAERSAHQYSAAWRCSPVSYRINAHARRVLSQTSNRKRARYAAHMPTSV